MAQQRHEIPTHLNVEDRAFYGLTIRQVMYLTIGLSGGYALWNQLPAFPVILRGGPAVLCLVLALTFALLRPHSRSLDEWAFVALHHAAIPKASVWRPREPEVSDSQEYFSDWEELTPHLAWTEEER